LTGAHSITAEEAVASTTRLPTIAIVAAAILLMTLLSSCVIGGEVRLELVDKLVTTDVAIARTGAPITAATEVRGVWRFGATAAYAVTEGRMELVPPGVVLLPGESLGKDISLRLERRNRDGAAVETHTIQFTSNVPQELVLLTRFKSVDGDNWTFDFDGRQAKVIFEPVD